jgi:1,4-dihydroxy-2-naphthoate octaprenyltransferase
LSLAGAFDPMLTVMTLAGSVLMQVVTNLQNDVGYAERLVGRSARVGLPRATANGWLAARAVRGAIVAAIAAATLVGLPLVIRGGWPIVAIGVGSLCAAYGYMGGPRPIAYTPAGELTVFLFFGLAAVGGSYFVQTGTVGAIALLVAAAIGAHAAAVLLVNNYRDRAHDAATGRRTLPVVIGGARSLRLFALLELAPFALALVAATWAGSLWYALPLLALPQAWRLVRDLARTADGPEQNPLLFRAVMLEVGFGLLLCAGAIAHRML